MVVILVADLHQVFEGDASVAPFLGELGLNLAILLAKAWKNPQIQDDVHHLVRHLKRESDDEVDEEKARDTVMKDTQETFWETAIEPLRTDADEHGINIHQARNGINQDAKDIHDHAEEVSANWRLPVAVVSGLPDGLAIALYDTEAIGRVIKELAAPPD